MDSVWLYGSQRKAAVRTSSRTTQGGDPASPEPEYLAGICWGKARRRWGTEMKRATTGLLQTPPTTGRQTP